MNRQDAKSAKDRQGRVHPGDILIGEDEWIRFIELDGDQARAENLDSWIFPLNPFLQFLVLECVPECCGIDAYRFMPQDIREAASRSELDDLESKLLTLHDQACSLDSKCVVSSVMNQYFNRQVFIQLVEHLLATVRQIPPQTAEST
jgi:hypothetical protein